MMLAQAAANATEAAPWWGVPVIAGSFLIVGALLTFFANWVIKRRELDQAEVSRWDKEVLDTATLYLASFSELNGLSDPKHADYVADVATRQTASAAIKLRQDEHIARLRLTAPVEVTEAALNLIRAAAGLFIPNTAAGDALSKFHGCRDAFIAAVRTELRTSK